MSDRQRLPNRRQHETIEFELEGMAIVAGIGRFADGRLAEVFFHSAGKPGSTGERFAADAAVLVSLALQRGATVSEIRHSLVKLHDGSGAGPVGRLLDLIEGDFDED
jgi:hypothetical protein